MALGPALFSLGRLLPGDPGDMRFCEYLLEHGLRWLTGSPSHPSFWSPPFFFPHPNALAYSETLFGVALPYWLARGLLALAPDQAMLVWLASLFALNFWAAYIWLRKDFKTQAVSSSIGAFLIAFGSARVAQVNHPQMIATFYVILAARALPRIVALPEAVSTRRLWFPVFFISLALQFWSGFYYFYFFFLGLLILTVWALCHADRRLLVLNALKANRRLLLVWSAVALVLMSPALFHYGMAAKEMARNDFGLTKPWLPIPGSWFFMGKGSWLYSWQKDFPPWRTLLQNNVSHEHALGVGWVTFVLACLGLRAFAPRIPLIRPLVLLSVVFFACTTLFFPHVAIWGILYEILPGAPAVRTISRIGLMTLLPMSIGAALFFEKQSRWGPAIVLLALICILEQGHTLLTYDAANLNESVTALASRLDSRRCKYFYFNPPLNAQGLPAAPSWQYAIDAMWIGIHSGIPTINGYSGNFPPGYTDVLFEIGQGDANFRDRQRLDLQAWIQREQLSPLGLCMLSR